MTNAMSLVSSLLWGHPLLSLAEMRRARQTRIFQASFKKKPGHLLRFEAGWFVVLSVNDPFHGLFGAPL